MIPLSGRRVIAASPATAISLRQRKICVNFLDYCYFYFNQGSRTMIRFQLFGRFGVQSDDGVQQKLRRKSECLICLLALSEGLEATREHAAGADPGRTAAKTRRAPACARNWLFCAGRSAKTSLLQQNDRSGWWGTRCRWMRWISAAMRWLTRLNRSKPRQRSMLGSICIKVREAT